MTRLEKFEYPDNRLDWFNITQYDRTAKFTETDWLHALLPRYLLINFLEEVRSQNTGNLTNIPAWDFKKSPTKLFDFIKSDPIITISTIPDACPTSENAHLLFIRPGIDTMTEHDHYEFIQLYESQKNETQKAFEQFGSLDFSDPSQKLHIERVFNDLEAAISKSNKIPENVIEEDREAAKSPPITRGLIYNSYGALLVNYSLPDSVLEELFRSHINMIRNQMGNHTNNKQKKKVNKIRKTNNFNTEKWTKSHVLPYADLYIASLFDDVKLTDAVAASYLSGESEVRDMRTIKANFKYIFRSENGKESAIMTLLRQGEWSDDESRPDYQGFIGSG